MDVVGTISSVISLAQITAETVNRLRLANEINEDVKSRLDTLHEQSSLFEENFRSIKAKFDDDSSTLPQQKRNQVKLQVGVVSEAIKKVNSALVSVKTSAPPSSSSSALRRSWWKTKMSVKTAFNISSTSGKLDTAKSKLQEAISVTSQIMSLMDLEELKELSKNLEGGASSTKGGVFVKHFDRPEFPQHVVLDYKTPDQNGGPVTAEGRLMRTVIALSRGGETRGVPAVGSLGMGGVGKTTALRALCHAEKVKEAYPDGIWFMEFGEDARDEKVAARIRRCVENSGGDAVAKEMGKTKKLSNAIELASAWLRRRKILLVCDDLWPIKAEDVGYVCELKSLLEDSNGSVLVVSTRHARIAERVGNATPFEPLAPRGEKARAILLKAVSSDFSSNAETEVYMDKLLDICAGLPLTLSIAGAGLKLEVKRHAESSSAIKQYCEKLERFVETSVESSLLYYPRLSYVIHASLSHCEQWRQGARKFFRALCVLERQATIPIRSLSGMWGVSVEEGSEIAEKMEEASLLRIVPCGEGTGVRLHDLVLKLCQGMVEAVERRSWHEKLCDSYMASLSEVGAWWGVEDDSYIMDNLSRHLMESGRVSEVHDLVCDVRWAWRRRDKGGWIAWEMDYKRVINGVDSERRGGMQHVHWVVKRCWARLGRSQFPFLVYGHLSKTEREEPSARRLLDSIAQFYPKPWVRPFDKCMGPKDAREVSMWKFDYVTGMAVCWAKEYIVIAIPHSIIVWSMSRNEQLKTIICEASSIALSADGQQIVSGCEDGTVRRWDLHTGESIGEPLRGHEDVVSCVAISADGKQIVSGSWDGTVRRWDADTGESIGDPLRGHEDKVSCVAISADGLQIVSGADDCTVRRWDAHTGESIGDPLRGHADMVFCVAISADGQQIVSGSRDCTLRRWDLHTGDSIGEPLRGHQHGVTCVTVSADGQQIVSGSSDATVRLWDAHTGESIGEPLHGHDQILTCVAVSADGQKIVSACEAGTVRRWDTHTGDSIGEPLRGHKEEVTCVAVSADGKLIVSGSRDGTMHRWDAHTGESIGEPLRGHEYFVMCVAISADGKQIISGSFDGTVRRWDAHTGDSIGEPLRGHEDGVTCVAVSADGKQIVSGSNDCTVRLWDAHTGESIGEPLRGHEDEVRCVAISADSKQIVSGSMDCTVRRWDAHTGECIGEPLRGHKSIVTCVAVSADGKKIVSGYGNGTVRLWDAYTGESIGEPLRGHYTEVECVAVSADGREIVSGSEDGTMRRWDGHTGKIIGLIAQDENDDDIISKVPDSGRPMRVSNDFDRTEYVSSFAIFSDLIHAVVGFDNGCVALCKVVEDAI